MVLSTIIAGLAGVAAKTAAVAGSTALATGKTVLATATSPKLATVLQKGKETYNLLEPYLQQNEGEEIMEIKTADGGHRNVASQGIATWGAIGGGLGTLALLNQLGTGGALFGAPFFGGAARGFGYGGGYGAGAGHVNIDIAMASRIATLESEKYTDHKDDRIWQKVCELDKEQALNKQATEFLFRIANGNIQDVYKFIDCHCVKNSKFLNACKIVGGKTADGYTMNLPTVVTDPCCNPCCTSAPTPAE